MALKKFCRCGKIIDQSLKYCPECSEKVAKNKKDTTRYYDKHRRNKESKEVYHSKGWDILREQCKAKFNGLDIYSYYTTRTIEYGSIAHHIEEITVNKDRVYDLENLIYLTPSNHNTIHALYKTDYEGTKAMLFNLIQKWKEEINIT